ncbi:uncharacterized protein LOC143546109 [Bidens hawaiensis]|uniref:uncharacterized protein LOC143546109 n=1 Tax=Bidens hawaiensis TaxID=980011 RepID=UPI0040492ABD
MEVEKEQGLVVSKKKKKPTGKKVEMPVVQGLDGDAVYVPEWSVRVGDTFKDPEVCADALAHFAPPGVRDTISKMEGDSLLSWLILNYSNVSALLAEGVTHFRKGMEEYEEFMNTKEKMKASMAAMKKDVEGFSEKEKVYVKRIEELSRGHEIEMAGLKKAMEADMAKLSADREAFEVQKRAFEMEKEGLKASVTQTSEDNKWLIEMGFSRLCPTCFIPRSLTRCLVTFIRSC